MATKKSAALAALMILSASASLAATQPAAQDGKGAVANTYVKTCRFERPLDTYDGCDDDTWAGRQAEECAENEAVVACQNAYNSDCNVVGTTYKTIISEEFIGYKACEATVIVHGFRIIN